MTHVSPVMSGIIAGIVLGLPGMATAQEPESSPLEFGVGAGVTLNQPIAFGQCTHVDARGLGSIRGVYSFNDWLSAELHGTYYLDFVPPPRCTSPNAHRRGEPRSYPHRLDGGSFPSSDARIVVTPFSELNGFRPILIGGVGRIWSKELTYPEFGVGVELPGDAVSLRVTATSQWLSLPFDSVTAGGERIPRQESHFPLFLQAGLGWQP